MDYISVLKGYVEGTVTVDELKNIYFSDVAFQKYLNDNLPTNIRNYAGIRMSNGDINKVFKNFHWGTRLPIVVCKIILDGGYKAMALILIQLQFIKINLVDFLK